MNVSDQSDLLRWSYLPFGEEIAVNVGLRSSAQGFGVTDPNRRKYGLTERDATTGLDHTWWRKHESLSGRWTSPDPLRGTIAAPQSFNAYTYAGNDPVNFIDPTGLDPQGVLGGLLGPVANMGPDRSFITVPISWNDPILRHGGSSGDGTEWRTLAVIDRGDLNPGGAQSGELRRDDCTFNINISGVTGDDLNDMKTEIMRIFASGGFNVVFGQPEQANGGSANVTVTPQFFGNIARTLGRHVNTTGFIAYTLGSDSQVNSTHVFNFLNDRGSTLARTSKSASYGTVYGRAGAHEAIAHAITGGIGHPIAIPPDVRSPTIDPKTLGERTNSMWNIGAETARALRAKCP